MKFRNIPFKVQLFTIPFLAVIMFGIIALVQKHYIVSFHDSVNKTIVKDIESLKDINQFESKLSNIFGKIHDLILHVEKDIDGGEEYVYTNGKPLIYKLHEQKKFLDETIVPTLNKKIEKKDIENILKEFEGYTLEATSAITMVTVDLELARENAANTAVYYNNIIKSLEIAKESFLTKTEKDISDTVEYNLNEMETIYIILALIAIMIFYLGLKISKDLSNKFSLIINSIRDLSQEKEDIEIPEFKNNKELQNISSGLKTFQNNIEEIKDLHQKDLQTKEQLHKSEKLAAMGEMIGNIAHQWRQPLTIISTSATSMQVYSDMDILEKDFIDENCRLIEKNVNYLSQTIDDFKNFIKGDRTKKIFFLNEAIDRTFSLVKPTLKKHDIHIINELKDDIEINGFENELSQCLINIINNSKDAYIENETDDRYLFISSYKDEDHAYILIKDNAGGIPENILSKIFEPYFTTKHQSQGTGLGLHMTHQIIVEGMDGDIKASNKIFKYENNLQIGAEFEIKIPLS